MQILHLALSNFRGIKVAEIDLFGSTALIGPNGAGKSTIIDALCLAFGRQKLVSVLTEHDFFGSSPSAADRFLIVATLGGFSPNSPDKHPEWFRKDRGVPKWWSPKTRTVAANPAALEDILCVQIGLVGRFDHDELEVETRRYFHDSNNVVDAFDDDAVVQVPMSLLNEIGFYLLPARRTWEAAASFGSELFRRTVTGSGALPSSTVIAERDALRSPAKPLEDDPKLKVLADRINAQLAQLMPGSPRFQLRVTSTDSESLLRALVPHYARGAQPSLPASRQGTGLLALQALVLLLEVGRARKAKGRSFILALEEPELHVAPGLQRRIISCAQADADQVLCTTHSPEVAAEFRAECVRVLRPSVDRLLVAPLLEVNAITALNVERRLAQDFRAQVVDALMHECVLVPEGRIDHEWLRLLSSISAATVVASGAGAGTAAAPFATQIGTIPTPDARVKEVCTFIKGLHDRVLALVDGDAAGDGYINDLVALPDPPTVIVQWPSLWAIEDVIGWIVDADPAPVLKGIAERTEQTAYPNAAELVTALKTNPPAPAGLKQNYLAYQDISAAIASSEKCVVRSQILLDSLVRAALGPAANDLHLESLRATSTKTIVLRFHNAPRTV